MSAISQNVRKTFGESDAHRDKGLTTPPDIERFNNIVYGRDLKWNQLDVYRQKGGSEKILPVLVNFHGGAWVYGDKDTYQFYCMSLAQHGFAVVNFSYRLAPESKFPAPIEDAIEVFRWIFVHAEEYGVDLKNIFAVGDSAGVNLLNILIMMCINYDYAKKFKVQPVKEFKPKAVLLNCGAYYITTNNDSQDLTTCLMKDYLPNGGDETELDMINSIEYMTREYPPAFVMNANEDFLRDEAPIMMRKLHELRIPYKSRIYGKKENPLQHVFQCNIKLVEANLCTKEQCDFLKEYIEV